MLTLLASLAAAAPLVPAFDAAHTWKIEVYSYDPAMSNWSSDYRDEEMEVVAVTLTCKPSGRPRVELCAPVDGKIWWGYRLVGESEVKLHELTTAGAIEIGFSERGRVVRFDWVGDRSRFWADACRATMYLDRTMTPETHVCTDDSARRVGARFEELIANTVLRPLDVELPKGGDAAKPWKPSAAPLAGRAFQAGVMASTSGVWTAIAGDEPKIRFEGQVSERPVSGGSMASNFTSDTVVRMDVTLGADGRPLAVEAHSVTTSNGQLYGFRQTDTWLTTVEAASTPPGPDPRKP